MPTNKKTPRQRIRDVVLATPPFLLEVGGKVYKLTNTNFGDINEALKYHYEKELTAAKSTLSKIIQDTQKELKEEMQKLRTEAVVPLSLLLVLREGIMTAQADERIRYLLPFKYAPKYKDGLPIIHPEKLVRSALAKFGYHRGALVAFDLINTNGQRFDHYHRHCLGGFVLPPNTLPKDLPELRTRIEVLYENINTRDLAEDHPHGLPYVKSIETTEKAGENVWKPPSPEPETTEPKIVWKLADIRK